MSFIHRIIRKIRSLHWNKKFRNVAPGCNVPCDITVSKPDNLIMEHGSALESGTLILNINSRFVMGKYSGAGPNLTVVTGNHMSLTGKYLMEVTDEDKKLYDPEGINDQDVVLEEDVWLGANVVLLNGVRIGRGAVVAAGTVCRTKIPPYAIVAGNPAKVVGFRFTPDQVEEHESLLYAENDRLSRLVLDKNYKKYYLNRLQEINQYCRI